MAKKSKNRTSLLSKLTRNRTLAVVFAVLFAGAGSVYLWRTHAATGRITVNSPAVAIADAGGNGKYWIATSDGGVFAMGNATYYGSMAGKSLVQPLTSMAARPQHDGYWLLGGDGGVFGFGSAAYHNKPNSSSTAEFYRAIISTPDGGGYWVISNYGNIMKFGDANIYSGVAASGHNSIDADIAKYNEPTYGTLNGRPGCGIVAADRSTSGNGLILVGCDGSVYVYGDMPYRGGANTNNLIDFNGGYRARAVAVDNNNGYIIVANYGAVYAFGTAYRGGATGITLQGKIISTDFTPDKGGYWLLGQDGGIFAFGNAIFNGALAAPTTHVCWDGKTYPSTQACPAQPAPTPTTTAPTGGTGSSGSSGSSSTSVNCSAIAVKLVQVNNQFWSGRNIASSLATTRQISGYSLSTAETLYLVPMSASEAYMQDDYNQCIAHPTQSLIDDFNHHYIAFEYNANRLGTYLSNWATAYDNALKRLTGV